MQIIFPERSGALAAFLAAISPTWNVTLFHYRNTGNRESSVLLGCQVRQCAAGGGHCGTGQRWCACGRDGSCVVAWRSRFALERAQVPPEDSVKFNAAIATLPEFTFKELSADVRSVFDRFIL